MNAIYRKPSGKATPSLSVAAVVRCGQVARRYREGPGSVFAGISAKVSEATGIPIAEIYGRSRIGPVSEARQIVMYECRVLGFTLEQIGENFNRHHVTILRGIEAERARRA